MGRRSRAQRVLTIGDTHCGHEVGLTPPEYNPKYTKRSLQKMSEYRKAMWAAFKDMIYKYGPFDICIANGDLIDGRGEKIGGTEEIFVDRDQQIDMAIECLRQTRAKKFYITRGTDYHVGPYENFENEIAKGVQAEAIGDILPIDINGVIFNVRHHIGGSQSPIGRATPLVREDVWNALWAIKKDFVRADVIIRSHVHYFMAVQQPDVVTMTLPALQGFGTRFGERRLSGIVDFGGVVFNVEDKEHCTWHPVIYPFPSRSPYRAG